MILAPETNIWTIPFIAPSEARFGADALTNNAKEAMDSSQSSGTHQVLELHTVAHEQADRQHKLDSNTQPHC
jgi:hypothetical protein